MNFSLIFPLILFLMSILFTLILFRVKSKGRNLNELKKTLKESSDKAVKNLEQKVVETEEQVTLHKMEATKICKSLDAKLDELNSHGEELSLLSNSLNEYRNMLAQLNIATGQTHEWVLRINNDAEKLQELQTLIDSHEKSTYEVLNSFDQGVIKQKEFFENFSEKIQQLNDEIQVAISTKRDESISAIDEQIQIINKLNEDTSRIESKQIALLKQIDDQQEHCRVTVQEISSSADDNFENLINEKKSSLENNISTISLKKLSLFDQLLEERKNEGLFELDRVIKGAITTLNLYNFKSEDNSEQSNIKIEEERQEEESNSKSVSEFDVFENEVCETEIERFEIESPIMDNSKIEKAIDIEIEKDKSKKEKRKKIDKEKSNEIDENQSKEEFHSAVLIDDYQLSPSIDFFDNNYSSSLKKEENHKEEINLSNKESGFIENDSLLKESDEKADIIFDETSEDEKVEKEIKEKSKPIKKEKLPNFTGFGSLLDSYGSSKRPSENEKKEEKDESQKTFRPGLILKQAVESEDSNEKKDEEEEIRENLKEKLEEKASIDRKYIPLGEEEEILLD